MMLTRFLFLCCIGIFLQKSFAAEDQSLEQAVQKLIEPRTADTSLLDEEATTLVASGTQRRFYTKDELAQLISSAKAEHADTKVTNFKVLHRETSGDFSTITYSATWHYLVNGRKVDKKFVSHEIWDHRLGEWHRVFAAFEAMPK